MKKNIYTIIRAAVFILLPVFFYFRPFMPEPLQMLFLIFSAAVLLAEITRFFAKKRNVRWIGALPLMAGLAALWPYRTYLGYFEQEHLYLMILTLFMGVLYGLEAWISTRNSSQLF